MFLLAQIPAVYWWYKTSSHAAELTAGFYNPSNQDGYSPVFDVLKKHSVIVKLVCCGMPVAGQEEGDALADPESLNWQVEIFLSILCFFFRSLSFYGCLGYDFLAID